MKTFGEFRNDGTEALEYVIRHSPYGALAQAVASLTVFSHPETVLQTGNRALFPMIRDASRRGQLGEIDGRKVFYDDNSCAHAAFLWSNGLRARNFGRDIQFNHVYRASADPDSYTCLANICVTPAFLAKVTDVHSEIQEFLRFRVYDLYKWRPANALEPVKPSGYGDLIWAPTLPPVVDVAANLRLALSTRKRDRVAIAVATLGWLFSPSDSLE